MITESADREAMASRACGALGDADAPPGVDRARGGARLIDDGPMGSATASLSLAAIGLVMVETEA